MALKLTLASILIALGVALSGCAGGDSNEDPIEPTLAEFLDVEIRADRVIGGVWFEPGTQIGVEAIVPENAVGNVTYTWAVQPDPSSEPSPSAVIDTGPIQPGGSGNITFTEPGFYEFGHCDPHPWMMHSVAVLADYDGPDALTVYIVEGDVADLGSYRFSDHHITVGVGTSVTYVNLGQIMHTASIAHRGESIPTPTTLGLTGASGTVTLQGSGWMNLLVFAEDEAGNAGWGRLNAYVREKFADYDQTSSGQFTSMQDPSGVHSHTFEWSGNLTLNVAVDDPTGTLNRIDVRLAELDADGQPLINEQDVGTDSFTARITAEIPRVYELIVTPRQGLMVAYEIQVVVEYDHTPPPRGDDLPCPEPHYSLGHC